MPNNIDYAALDAYLDRRDPVQQSIAIVISGSGSKAWVKPLGSGGKPIEVRVAVGTPLAAGDEVYMIRSKWQPDWIILTNLGKANAASNIQNTVPVHASGAKQGKSISRAAIGTSISYTFTSASLWYEVFSWVHNSKSDTLEVDATMRFSTGAGVTTLSFSIWVDGIEMFPVLPPISGAFAASTTFYLPFSAQIAGLAPGEHTISFRVNFTSGVAGTLVVYTATAHDL